MPKRAVQKNSAADGTSVTVAARDAAAAGNVIVIATDAALLDLLKTAVGDRHKLWRTADTAQAAELLLAAPASVLLVDAAVTDKDTPRTVEQLHQQFPGVPVVVTGRRDDEAALSALISTGAVFRFLHKPLSEERARTFVEAAARRLAEQPPTSAPQPRPAEREAAETGAAAAPVRPRRRLGPVLALLGVVVAAIAAIALLRPAPPEVPAADPRPETAAATPASPAAGMPAATAPPVATVAPAAAPSGVTSPEVARLLSEARIALDEGRYAEPAGGNAIESFRAALALEPSNAAALEGLSRTAELLLVEVDFALRDGNLAVAATGLDAARAASPEHPRLAELSTRLGEARTRLMAPAAAPLPQQPAPSSRPPARGNEQQAQFDRAMDSAREAIAAGDPAAAETWLERAAALGVDPPAVERLRMQLGALRAAAEREERARLLALANQRLAQGRLVEPGADSARHYVDLLRAADSGFEGLAETAALLGERLLADARRLAEQGAFAQAERLLDAATGYAPAPAVRDAREQIGLSQARAAEAARRTPLVLRTYVAPAYPQRAATRGMEGWVEVEFTVAPDGRPRDIVVVDARPSGVFDEAALTAVAAWRYDPPAGGERRVVQRLKFDLGSR